MKKIKEMVINAKVKMVKAKDRMVKVTLAVASALGVINMPVYADAGELHLDNMNNVVQSLKNIIGYAATIFIAGGAAAALWGGYSFFQALRSQDGEAKHKATIEVAAGLGAVVVGSAASIFKDYITLM